MSIITLPLATKNQPRLSGSRLVRLQVLCFSLSSQHIFLARRQSALPVKEGAVGKGEVEKCASTTHGKANIGAREKPCQEICGCRGLLRVSV
jgi:hypothetical protein